MKLRIINDIHLYGVNPTHTLDDISFAIQSSPWPVYLLGDVVDIANCHPADLQRARQATMLLSDNVKRNGGQYIMGNHERNALKTHDEFLLWESVLLTHGDIPMWGIERATTYRSGKQGAGWLKRNVISPAIDGLRRYFQVRPNKNLLEWIDERKRELPTLRIVIMGHSHPEKIIEFKHSEVRGVILPRGVNDITIEL